MSSPVLLIIVKSEKKQEKINRPYSIEDTKSRNKQQMTCEVQTYLHDLPY